MADSNPTDSMTTREATTLADSNVVSFPGSQANRKARKRRKAVAVEDGPVIAVSNLPIQLTRNEAIELERFADLMAGFHHGKDKHFALFTALSSLRYALHSALLVIRPDRSPQ
jgi:hypothetical protein